MEVKDYLNILVLGNSGAGKSTHLQKITTYLEAHPEVLKHFKAEDIFKILTGGLSQKRVIQKDKP